MKLGYNTHRRMMIETVVEISDIEDTISKLPEDSAIWRKWERLHQESLRNLQSSISYAMDD